MIVTLEGIDNCGKNTVATQLLHNHPQYSKVDFPDYNSPLGKLIKSELYNSNLSPLSLQLLFSAERLNRCDTIKSASDQGIVITTRYSYSALAYGIARGLNRNLLLLLEENMPKPDIKIFLHISPEESIKRSLNPDSFESNYELLKAVDFEYKKIIHEDSNWIVINAMKSISLIVDEVENIINNKGMI